MGSKRAKEKNKKAEKPTFDEAALAHLTSKIDKSLADSNKQAPIKRKRQRDNDDGPVSKRHQTSLVTPKSKGAHGEERKNKQPSLLDEILALGGDEADLELVANVDSGNEDGDTPKFKTPAAETLVDKALKDELTQFASSLGFHKFHQDEQDPVTDNSEDMEDTSGSGPEEDGEEEEEITEEGDPSQGTRQGKQSGKLIFEPRPDWHGVVLGDLPTHAMESLKHHSTSITNLKSYAETLLEQDSASYAAMQASSSSQKFMSTIMSSGTLSDKVSALTLSAQESPLHSRKAFDSLITLAGKRSRGQAIAALGALVDLLGNGSLLPNDRRLRLFNGQPGLLGTLARQEHHSPWIQGQKLPGKLTKTHLMVWAYEDWLKSAYFRIIQLLEVWCSDEIEYSRSRALDFVFGLLKNKPEQEANLLRLLVNKLGDRERKIASRASYLLLQLLNVHPGMKAIVISTVEQEVLLKPGQSLRTRYSAINTLNQTILSTKEPALADTLLRIYFDTFLSLLKSGSLGDFEVPGGEKEQGTAQKKSRKRGGRNAAAPGNEQETAQKLISSLLTGVNRAIPFATADDSTLEKHLDTLFRITHSSNFNTSVQALMLIQQLATSKQLTVDRFYRTLYESLLDPRLITSSKHALYLNLLYRAMKNDVDIRRVKAFVKRLIQVLTLHQPSFTCGILFLIAELQATFPDLHTLLDEPEDDGDDGEEVYKDVREDEPQTNSSSQAAPGMGNSHCAAYDGRKRDPEHSNAHRSCLWELVPFFSHYHPSVCVFAMNLLARQKALPKPDLANHTLMHFLDKFVYRNPKAEESKRGGSIMQPVLASGSAAHIVASSKAGVRQQPIVNSSSFWNLKPDQVSAEDAFFHEYFARIGKPGEGARVKKATEGQAGSEDETSEEEIWDALVNSQPNIEGPDADEDSDVDLDGYDYSDNDMEVDGHDDDEKTSALEFETPEDDAGFEGIFDDSEESDEAGASEDEAPLETGKAPSTKEVRKGRLSRREMRSLPTFASADDYAEMLAAEDGLDD
ncbi:Ribosome biogenesis protein MAK21 [Madurella mycetomatis]|uniref:Ribosome biogenesis protein MAK21 n=1 Tax=Madurella mycetomatis TaxID=100816 RepID=A0A175VW19_9PEZI|nr:Ribosome biogenesis protein MAK21 [Madurella mycetomatis]